ncbi:polysaccharide deacetylase family protein [Hydrogenophaga sp.]|uniref:polysaccharide deacetylase family protein n=1 Tax=Hydrogenophaga sp. TaxID=1904254 RepID=UPI003F6BCE71
MNVYLTVDTELASGLYRLLGPGGEKEIFDRSIRGRTNKGDVGLGYQMDVLERYGLKGVFFVDPMPSLVLGVPVIREMVKPVVERGHDVQLHLHTEWLQYADCSPVEGRLGSNIKDFTLEDQSTLIKYASGALVEAGAPAPVAFRAGNYGANDDTLRALGLNGIQYDTSFCPGIDQSACQIELPREVNQPVEHCGLIEVPIGAISGANGRRRHAQLTALSAWEIMAALDHAHQMGAEGFTLVSHSFELMSRDRTKANHIVRHRFEKVCAALGARQYLNTATYHLNPPVVSNVPSFELLGHSYVRTVARNIEQAASNYFYGAR